MPRGRNRVKKIVRNNSGADADALNDMFSQMTGAEDADPDIIIPKFIKINEMIEKYAKIFTLLLNFDEFINNFTEYSDNFDEIKTFVNKLNEIVKDGVSSETLKESTIKNVNIVYKKLKNLKEVQSIVTTSGNLSSHKKFLTDSSNLSDDFIKREPGLSFTPLTFTSLDLKKLWVSDKLSVMAQKYILNILSHTYKIGHEIYKIITSPDIDIKKFSRVLINNIEKMKKQVPRCNKAFDIIANSVHLLENNFDGYYKNSIEAENPSIIVENFIVDVSVSQNATASTTAQFRKIIMFMKKQSAGNKDPRVAKLFKILNSQFNMMQRETGIESDSDDEKDENKEESEDTNNVSNDSKGIENKSEKKKNIKENTKKEKDK